MTGKRLIIIAPSQDQGKLTATRLGIANPRIISTQGSRGLPDGLYPLPDDVHYAPGWELGRNADRVLAQLRSAYRKRLAA